MSWLNATLEVSSNAIEVNTEGLGLRGEDGKEVKTLMAKPLSAHEYQVLKNDPELRTLVGADKTELLGLKMTFEMLKKCDSSLKWQQFRQLLCPSSLKLLNELHCCGLLRKTVVVFWGKCELRQVGRWSVHFQPAPSVRAHASTMA